MDNKIDGVRQQNKESLKALKTAVTLAMLAFAGGGQTLAAENSVSVTVPANTTQDQVSGSSVGDDIKSCIKVNGTVNTLSTSFTSGHSNIVSTDDYDYSVILSEAGGVIKDLTSKFDSNTVTVNNKVVSGALVNAIGEITNFSGIVQGNTLTTDSFILGGLVSVDMNGTISDVTSSSSFSGNTIKATGGASIEGGVFYNQGSIGSMETSFTSNTVTSESGNISGGAFANSGTVTGDMRGVNFEGNAISSTSGDVKGGAFYNDGILSGAIINSTFKNNSAVSTGGSALGGAIYTTTDVKLVGDGGTTLFQGNYVQDGSGRKNQAIYVDSRIAQLTLEAKNGGEVLLYDNINGLDGYNLVFTGDSTGKIGLYGNVTNANVNAVSGNIDFVNSKFVDMDFGQFTSSENAKYAIDVDFANGKADTFTAKTGSSGTIFIDSINSLGLSDETTQIKILNAPTADIMQIVLSDAVKSEFSGTEQKIVTWNDAIPEELAWGDVIYKYERNDTVNRKLDTTSSVYGGLADSLLYTVTTTEGTTTSSILGDTLRLVNQAEGVRNLRANTSRNTLTVTEDLGSTGAGTFNLVGVRDTQFYTRTSVLDANEHSLFVLDKAANLSLSDITVQNLKAEDGSFLNITNPNAVVNLDNVLVSGAGFAGIVNDGTLNLTSRNSITANIIGQGIINITGYSHSFNGNIIQDTINIVRGGTHIYFNGGSIDAKIINNGAFCTRAGVTASLTKDIINNGSWEIAGTLNANVTGTGSFIVYNNSSATLNALVEQSNINLYEKARLTVNNTSNLHSKVSMGANTNLYLGDGEYASGYGILGSGSGQRVYITGDVKTNSAIAAYIDVAAGKTFTVSNIGLLGGNNSSTLNLNKDSQLNILGGTSDRYISGSGVVNILGDTTLRDHSDYSAGINSKINIAEGVTFNATSGGLLRGSADIVNDGRLTVDYSGLNRPISGSGVTEIRGNVIGNSMIAQAIQVNSGCSLQISPGNIGGAIENNGTLSLNAGTLNQTIAGTGSINLLGSVTSNSAINQAVYCVTGSLTINADNVGGNIHLRNGALYLTGGTADKHANMDYIVNRMGGAAHTGVSIQNGSYVNFNTKAGTGYIRVNSGGNLWIDASNLSGDFNVDGTAHLGDGTWSGDTSGAGYLYIDGDTRYTGVRLVNSHTIITESGSLTAVADNVKTTITNNGKYYLSGTLIRSIAGASGTTYINGNLAFNTGASIAGNLDFNNGTLNLEDKSIIGYSIGSATGSGTLSLDLNAADGTADTLTLSSASNALITPDITLLNVSDSDIGKNLTYQILKGSQGAQLTLPPDTNTIKLNNREEDFVTSATVNANQTYEIRDKQGIATGNVSLSQTESANDTLNINMSGIEWGETVHTAKNLLYDWFNYNTTEKKTFEFSSADDVYTVLPYEFSKTITSVHNIKGVSDGTSVMDGGKVSTINFLTYNNTRKYFGLGVGKNGVINFSDVQLTGLGNYTTGGRIFFSLGNGATANFENFKYYGNSIHSGHFVFNGGSTVNNLNGVIQSNGNGSTVVQNAGTITNIKANFISNNGWTNAALYNTGTIGNADGAGIVGSLFQGNGMSQNGSIIGITLRNEGIIHNLKDTTFLQNRGSSSSPTLYRGIALANVGGRINYFDNVTFKGNYDDFTGSNTSPQMEGAGLWNRGTIADIQNSNFEGNHLTAFGVAGGGLWNSGTIKSIKNTDFTGNYLVHRAMAGQGGYGGAIYNKGTITEGITDSNFIGNYIKTQSGLANGNAGGSGGAIYTDTVIPLIKDSVFEDNYVNAIHGASGGAIYGNVEKIDNVTFTNNRVISRNNNGAGGGAISGLTNAIIENSTFKGNYADSHNGGWGASGGAVSVTNTVIRNSIFEDNYATGGRYALNGAIAVGTGVTIEDTLIKNNYITIRDGVGTEAHGGAIDVRVNGGVELNNVRFEGNHVLGCSGGMGGAIDFSHFGYITYTKNIIADFIGNYVDTTAGTATGGAINNYGVISGKVQGVFDGNYVSSPAGNAYGGAIATFNSVTQSANINNIYNSSFTNNYASGKSAIGGAIYMQYCDVKLTADNYQSIISGNYVTRDGGTTKDYQAIYIDGHASRSANLTFNAVNKGSFTIDDYITGNTQMTGVSRPNNVSFTGDGSGTVYLHNAIRNANVSVANTLIDVSGNDFNNYNFYRFTSADSAKYAIDLNLSDGSSDVFTVGYLSTGTMNIDKINFIGSAVDNYIYQVVKNDRADVKLALSQTKYGDYNVVDNFLEVVPDTVYNDGVYKQQTGIFLTTTDTYHDSIHVVNNEIIYDALNIIGNTESENPRNFVFRDNGNSVITYYVSKNLNDITAGVFNIKGIEGKDSVIDANGHTLFNLVDETEFNLSNVTVQGAEDAIKVSNAYAVVNLDNSSVNGNIKGDANFKINVTGGDNHIGGKVTNATTTITGGSLSFNRDTFAASNDKLVATSGNINLVNDVIENYVINELSSAAAARYSIDLDLNTLSSDTMTINSGSGTITIGNLNTIGSFTIDDVGEHYVKVLDTSSSAITLALSDEVRDTVFNLGGLRRDEVDTVANTTKFNQTYYTYYRLGIIAGRLSVDADTPDSIKISAVEQWDTNRTATGVLGDTLKLVVQSDLPVRILEADSVADNLPVNEDIGLVNKGELVIKGVNEGSEFSTVNLANHQGFVLGEDTSLSINNAKVTGSSTPIEIIDSSATVELNNSYIDGGIKSDVSYDLSLIGNGTTTVNGTLTNANATLSKGGFSFNGDTFAGANTYLTVENGGYVYMQDRNSEDYVFNNIVSKNGSNYAIDIDMVGGVGDSFDVKSGSGVITIDSVDVYGLVPELNKEYTVTLLNKNSNAISLAISENVQSQMNAGNFKLGTCGPSTFDTIKAVTKSTDIYYRHDGQILVYGHFRLTDGQDGLILTATALDDRGTKTDIWGDTLKLWSQFETSQDREFQIVNNSYKLTENLGISSQGNMSVDGGSGSTIDADYHSLFELAKDTTLNISNVEIINGRNSAGSILNVTNSDAVANFENVKVNSIGTVNGINNAGTLNFTGGTNTINTGISGTSGILNINNGAKVSIGENSNITQSQVNVNNGTLTLNENDVIYGSLSVLGQGIASMSASAITRDAANAGTLNLGTGTLAYAIDGAGTTNLNGVVTSYGDINQQINILAGAQLITSGDNIGGNVSNANILTLNSGTLTHNVTGAGHTDISGNVNLESVISQAINITENGSLTTSASNLAGAVTNNRDLNLIGGVLTQNVSGSGRTNISNGTTTVNSTITDNAIHLNSGVLKLAQTADITGASQLNVHSGTVDLQDNNIGTTNLGDLVLNGDMNLAIDVNLSNLTGDITTANSLSNIDNHSIIIDSIKVLADAREDMPLDVVIANNVLKDVIKLSTDTIKIQGAAPETSYLVSYNKTGGNLRFGYGNLATAVALNASERNYTMQDVEEVGKNLGSMGGGDGAVLTVIGNDFSVNQNGYKGITVNANQTLHISNVGSVDENNNVLTSWNGANSTTNGGVIQNNGTMDITESVFYNNKVSNATTGVITGGVIQNSGHITKLDGVFVENGIENTLNDNGNAYGGVLYNRGTVDEITGLFKGNYALGDDPTNTWSPCGGAIMNDETSNAHIVKIDATFDSNYVQNNDAGGALGGAIWVGETSSVDTINGTFTNNHAVSNGYAHGGAIYTQGTIGTISGSFSNNYAEATVGQALGGAIKNDHTITSITGGNFSGNYAKSHDSVAVGGAIGNWKTITDINTNFTSNHVESVDGAVLGGAILNYNNATIGKINGSFTGNYAESVNKGAFGGAINNYGTITNLSGSFSNNYAQGATTARGGVIYNIGTITDILSAEFTGNRVESANGLTYGSAIYNEGTIGDISGTFKSNTSLSETGDVSGSIANCGTINSISGSFEGNSAVNGDRASSGAINNNGDTSVITKGIDANFKNNYAESTGTSALARAGAILNFGNIQEKLNGSFEGNYAKSAGTGAIGGAIANMRVSAGTSKGIDKITGSFTSNHVTATGANGYAHGGAIYNTGVIGSISAEFTQNYAESVNGEALGGAIYNTSTITAVTNSTFSGNHANTKGGAIYNAAAGVINIADTNFSGNEANQNGGAIFNEGTVSIAATNKDVAFTANTANGVSNDIQNIGTLNLNTAAGKTITFSGSIDGADGSTTVDGDGTVNFSNKVSQNKVNVNSGTVNVAAGDLDITNGLTNEGTLNLLNGTLSSVIDGSGNTNINGNVTNNSTITQHIITVLADKQLINNVGKTITADELLNNGYISSGGNIIAEIVVNNSGITNGGTLTAGTLTNNSSLINNSTLTATTLNNNSGASISNSGTITTILNNAANADIVNSGNLIVNGGENNGTIGRVDYPNYSGTFTVAGDFTNTNEISQQLLDVNENGKLINNGKMAAFGIANSGEIENNDILTVYDNGGNLGLITGSEGTLRTSFRGQPGTYIADKHITQKLVDILGTLTNEGGITADVINGGMLDNNAMIIGNITNNGRLFSSATNLNGDVENTRDLYLEGGTFSHTLSGNGTTNVTGEVTNDGSITQSYIDVDASLTNNEGKTITVNNAFVNSGAVNNNGTIISNGILPNLGILNNSGTITANDLMNNTATSQVINDGTITAKRLAINAETSLVTNNGTLNVGNGGSVGIINGVGNLTLSGTFTNNGTITQSTVENTGTLTSNGAITADLTNSGTITNNSVITGLITNAVGGEITSSATNLVGAITNSGTLNLEGGEIQAAITGTNGTINVNGDLTVSYDISGNTLVLSDNTTTSIVSGGSLNLEGLTANGGKINAQNNNMDVLNLGNLVLNDDLSVSIDANLDNKTADRMTGTSVTSNGHSIIIDHINILADPTAEDLPIEINVADSVLKSIVKLTAEVVSVDGVKDNVSYLVTYADSTGNLIFQYGDLDSAVHLTAPQRNYTMAADENVGRDLGAMEDGLDVLTINGNGFKVLGNGHEGIVVNDGNTLNVNNVSEYSGFKTALTNESDGTLNIKDTIFKNNEKDIVNDGTLTFNGTNELDTLEGNGSTTVRTGKTTVNETLEQNDVTVKALAELENKGTANVTQLVNNGTVTNKGTLNAGTLTNNGGATITNSGTITAVLNNAANATLTNNNNLTINGGSNSGTINGTGTTTIAENYTNAGTIENSLIVDSTKTLTNTNTIVGSLTNNGTVANSRDLTVTGGENNGTINGAGTMTVAGDFTNANVITQNTLNVNNGSKLTNNGTATINNAIANAGEIENNNILNVNGTGTLGLINGTEGTLNANGTFTADKQITQKKVDIDEGSKLTNDGGITADVTNAGTLDNNAMLTGTLTTSGTTTSSATNLNGDVVNTGTLTFEGGTYGNHTLSGNGTTSITGEVTNDGSITQNIITVVENASLTNNTDKKITVNTDLTNDGTITNAGTINVANNLTNNDTITNSGSITADIFANNPNSEITNTGDLTARTLTNGEGSTITNENELSVTEDIANDGEITNSGTLTAGTLTNNSTVTNEGTLNAGTLTNNDGATITNSGAITAELNNIGSIANNKNLNITGGSNSGTISGTGNTKLSGTVTNTGTITQSAIENTGSLTSNGAIVANVTNSGTINNNSTITGDLTNSGTITNTSVITGLITNAVGGEITSSATNLVGNITNSGILNLAGGEIQGAITGTSGTINVNGDLTVSHGISGNTLVLSENTITSIVDGGSLNLEGLTGNGGKINAQNNAEETINLGSVILNSDTKLAIDTNLDEKWADNITATSVTGSGSIIIDSINILADSKDRIPVNITVADEVSKDSVKLDSNFDVTTSDAVKDSYFITYIKDDGTLKFEYLTLPVAVASETEQKVYVMRQDEIVDVSLGQMNGKTLTVNGGGNKVISTGDYEGITISENQELSLKDLIYTGFNTAVTNNDGVVNITDVTFEDNKNDVDNNGLANFYGKNFVNSITGDNGTLNIISYTDKEGNIVNSELTVNSDGSINQNIINITEDNRLINNGTVTSENLNNKGDIVNNNKLNINAGSNEGDITGSGDVEIRGQVVNSGKINQNILNIKDGAELTTKLDNITTTDNKITNDGTLYAEDGEIIQTVEGGGKTEIKGDVTNKGILHQESINVLEGGKLTTALESLDSENITTSGELTLQSSVIDKNIGGTSTGVVNLNQSAIFDSKISSTGVAIKDGTFYFGEKADLSGVSNFIVNSGTIDIMNNNATEVINLGQKMTMNGELKLKVDVDLANITMDRIVADSLDGDGFINIKAMNMLSDAKQNQTRVQFANEALKNNVKTDVKVLSYSPIWLYGVAYDNSNGEFVFTKGGNGNNGGYSAFNPSVLASPVATQVSGQLTMTQTMNEAFEHSDWYFKLPSAQRFAKIHNNEYAITSTNYNGNLGKIDTNYANTGYWTRPYANFETINLKNGPKVNMISYGTMVGGDSDFRKLKHGWANVGSAYIGYHGSQFNYNGSQISVPTVNGTTNGGVLGFTETFYKNNFYTAVTATAGSSFAEIHNMYGKEDLTMIMAGIASKSGYNFEMKDGKFIIQPNLFMSYSYVNTFDYNNSGGVSIDNKPLHTIQINPNLRFIGNTKGGWQPYATIGMVWNIMNKTGSYANGIELPEMSTKPYIEYGLGVQKMWDERFSAYGQATVRNGGRNGVALTAGFRWAIGKESTPIEKVENVSKPQRNVSEVKPVSNTRQIKTEKTEVKTKEVQLQNNVKSAAPELSENMLSNLVYKLMNGMKLPAANTKSTITPRSGERKIIKQLSRI